MFGENLRRYRIQGNYSQSDLAKKLYVTRQCISNWEKGVTQPDLETLEKISNLLGVSIDDLIKETDLSAKERKTNISPANLFAANILTALFCIISFIVFWRFIPLTIPAHWSEGAIDRYGSRNEIFLNFLTVFAFLIVDAIVHFATKRVDQKRGANIAHIVLILFQTANLILIIAIYAKHISAIASFVTCLSATLLLCVSIAMHPKINGKPNTVLGIRTSRTMKSPRIWTKTNTLACYLCSSTSLLILLINVIFILPLSYLFLLLFSIPTVTSIIYSKILSGKETDRGFDE